MPISPAPKVRFRERAELLDFLLEVAAGTSETLDLDRLMARVADIVTEVAPYELFAILLYSEKRKGLRIRYSIGHREEIVKSLVIPLDEGITGEAARSLETCYVPDVRSDPRYIPSVDAVRSELAVPMTARGKLVGVIDLQSTRLDTYTEHERALLELIASRVASATDNARLYRRVERQNRTLRTLARISQEFSALLPLDELLAKIASAVRGLINYDSFTLFLVDRDNRILRNRFSIRYDQLTDVDHVPLGQGITGLAAESSEVIRVNNVLLEPRFLPSHPEIRSELAVPLVMQNRAIGVMDLESDRVGFFTEDHVRLLSLLAPQLAASVENARLYEELRHREQAMEKDLVAAEELQAMLLLGPPEVEGLEIAIERRGAHRVSGDLYHFFQRAPGDALIAFGDVSGKGVAAALYGGIVTGLLSTLAPRRREPAVLLKAVNDSLLGKKIDARYVTLLVLSWKAPERLLTMANAGALPPYLCRRGEVITPRPEGVPLGLLRDTEYEQQSLVLQPGDLIVLYSDGVTDQLNETGEEYSSGRLCRLVSQSWEYRPEEVVRAIFADLHEFTAGAPRYDDQTLIVMRVT